MSTDIANWRTLPPRLAVALAEYLCAVAGETDKFWAYSSDQIRNSLLGTFQLLRYDATCDGDLPIGDRRRHNRDALVDTFAKVADVFAPHLRSLHSAYSVAIGIAKALAPRSNI